jgi:hypothetical protein
MLIFSMHMNRKDDVNDYCIEKREFRMRNEEKKTHSLNINYQMKFNITMKRKILMDKV